jgi:hypothetical protein
VGIPRPDQRARLKHLEMAGPLCRSFVSRDISSAWRCRLTGVPDWYDVSFWPSQWRVSVT